MGAVVVARHRQHAAVRMRSRHVGAMERVAGPIDARPLAVPHAEHAIEFLAREGVEFLGAQDHGGGEVFVDARLEADVMRRHQLLLRPKLPVQAAERRAAVAGDEARRAQSGVVVQPLLLQQQAQQGLDAGQQDRLVAVGKARFQCDGASFDDHVHGATPMSLS